jgi:hypothetical protein
MEKKRSPNNISPATASAAWPRWIILRRASVMMVARKYAQIMLRRTIRIFFKTAQSMPGYWGLYPHKNCRGKRTLRFLAKSGLCSGVKISQQAHAAAGIPIRLQRKNVIENMSAE